MGVRHVRKPGAVGSGKHESDGKNISLRFTGIRARLSGSPVRYVLGNTNQMGKIYCYVSPVSVPGYQEAPVRYVPEKHELRWEKYIATIGVPA